MLKFRLETTFEQISLHLFVCKYMHMYICTLYVRTHWFNVFFQVKRKLICVALSS